MIKSKHGSRWAFKIMQIIKIYVTIHWIKKANMAHTHLSLSIYTCFYPTLTPAAAGPSLGLTLQSKKWKQILKGSGIHHLIFRTANGNDQLIKSVRKNNARCIINEPEITTILNECQQNVGSIQNVFNATNVTSTST